MARKKKSINNTSIPQREIEIIARCIFLDILAFYESEEGQREFAEWKVQQAEESEKKALQCKQLTKHRSRRDVPPIWGVSCLLFTWVISFFAAPAVWIQGALTRRSGNK